MKVLFVCMGNICRSPTAEGSFRSLVAAEAPELGIEIDSAGTHAYHAGARPDSRSQAAALARNIDISKQRARVVEDTDFAVFDLVLAMDEDNLANLQRRCPRACRDRLHLFMDFAPDIGARDIPDPYYGAASGFEHVLDYVDAASRGLLTHIRLMLDEAGRR